MSAQQMRRKSARENAGFTLAQLAKRIGRKESTLTRYEREGKVSHARAVRLARVLDCPKAIWL